MGSITVDGVYQDSMLITSVVANRHPKLRSWILDGSLVKIEFVRVDYMDTFQILFTFANKQRIAIDLPKPDKHGSLVKRDITLLDNIKAVLTEKNIATMALLRTGKNAEG